MVTGMHTHAGQISDFYRFRDFCGSKWKPGECRATPIDGMTVGFIASSVAPRALCILGKWDEVFEKASAGNAGHERKRVARDFITELEQLDESIAKKNQKRPLAFHSFMPRMMDTSVYY